MTRWLCALLMTAALCWTQMAQAQTEDFHYLCRFSITDQGVKLEEVKRVDLPLQKPRFEQPRQEAYRFTLVDEKGRVLHTGAFHEPRRTRAELITPQGTQDHIVVNKADGAFLLALPPFLKGSKLKLEQRIQMAADSKSNARYAPYMEVNLSPDKTAEASPPPESTKAP